MTIKGLEWHDGSNVRVLMGEEMGGYEIEIENGTEK